MIDELNAKMIELLGIVILIIVILVLAWIVLEAYPAWKKFREQVTSSFNGHRQYGGNEI